MGRMGYNYISVKGVDTFAFESETHGKYTGIIF